MRTDDVCSEALVGHPWEERHLRLLVLSAETHWTFHSDQAAIVAVVVPPDFGEDAWGREGFLTPTAEEMDLLASVLEWKLSYYSVAYRERMARRPYDVDAGSGSWVFGKTAHGWRARRGSWAHGAVPFLSEEPEWCLRSLLLGRVLGSGGRGWEEWLVGQGVG